MNPQTAAYLKTMTLIHLAQRASILAGMTFASLSFHSTIDTTGKSNRAYSSDIGGNPSYTTITPGINYSASVTFKDVSERVVKAQLLNIATIQGNMQFRNVSFSS
jgi:hypothetical protein